MHQPCSGVGGTASDIKIQAEQMPFTERIVQERIAHHTGQPVETTEADSDHDRWFTAQVAKDYGLVDHVVRSAAQVPSEGGLLISDRGTGT
jgi:ATP-dependent Clp protease, protease subunit